MKPAKIVQFQVVALRGEAFYRYFFLDENGDMWHKEGASGTPEIFHKSPRKRKKTTTNINAFPGGVIDCNIKPEENPNE